MQRPGWNEQRADASFVFGAPGDTPVVGDWDGNGTQTPGTWRAGSWSLSNMLGSSVVDANVQFGSDGDQAIAGDWDGDGITTFGVFRDGVFTLRDSVGPDHIILLGKPGDRAIAGDFDGDGIDTVGVYSSAEGRVRVVNNLESNSAVVAATFMTAIDAQPIVGDWDDNGISTIGLRVGRQWTLYNLPIGDRRGGEWSLEARLEDFSKITIEYGEANAVPVVGCWEPSTSLGYGPAPASLKDLFVLAADFQPLDSFEKWKDRGINTVIRVRHEPPATDVEAFTAEANRLGLNMIREPRLGSTSDSEEKNLLAYVLADEPELRDGMSSEKMAAAIDATRAPGAAPRPVFVNFAGFNMLAQDDAQNGPGEPGHADRWLIGHDF